MSKNWQADMWSISQNAWIPLEPNIQTRLYCHTEQEPANEYINQAFTGTSIKVFGDNQTTQYIKRGCHEPAERTENNHNV